MACRDAKRRTPSGDGPSEWNITQKKEWNSTSSVRSSSSTWRRRAWTWSTTASFRSLISRSSPTAREDRENLFVNPQKPIPQEVQVLTHIAQSDVEGAPTFKELAPRLAETFRGCDFCGFNSNKFDVPMLSEEFSRAQVPFDFSESLLVDAQNIFHKMERRNLAAAYKFYTGHKMEDDFQSHRADQDAEATLRVLKGQLDMYAPGVQDEADRVLNNDIKELAEFSKMNDNVDFAGRIIRKEFTDAEGKVCRREVFNFGQHRGEAVADVVRNDPGFISWMLSRDFTYDTKNVVNRIRLREAYKNK